MLMLTIVVVHLAFCFSFEDSFHLNWFTVCCFSRFWKKKNRFKRSVLSAFSFLSILDLML